MTDLVIGTQTFTFDGRFTVVDVERDDGYKKYQNWLFAVRVTKKPEHWSSPIGQMIVDVILADAAGLWLVEMKDYRIGAVVAPLHLADAAARKVRDTLAYMASAALGAGNATSAEGAMYRALLLSSAIFAYLDVEWPPQSSPLAPSSAQLRANVQQDLERAFRNSGIVAKVVDQSTRAHWRV